MVTNTNTHTHTHTPGTDHIAGTDPQQLLYSSLHNPFQMIPVLLNHWEDEYIRDEYLPFPKDPDLSKNPGFSRTNPMTWGWDVLTINPKRNREGSGFLGIYIIWTCYLEFKLVKFP